VNDLRSSDTVTVLLNGVQLAAGSYRVDGATVTLLVPGNGIVEIRYSRTDTFSSTGTHAATADDDTVNAHASTLPLIIFGGQGKDTIHGGTGGDVVVGDRGRVLWFAPGLPLPDLGGVVLTPAQLALLEGVATAVYGHGGPGDRTDGTARLVGLVITVDPTVGGDDTITTGAGADVVLGGAGGDSITTRFPTSTASDIVLGDHGFVDRVLRDGDATDVDRVWSSDPLLGGDDHIVTANGDDIIIGGVGADSGIGADGAQRGLFAGHGNNIVIGDNGRITAASANTSRWGGLPLTVGHVETVEPSLGGDDRIVTGSGSDIVLGGAGGRQHRGRRGLEHRPGRSRLPRLDGIGPDPCLRPGPRRGRRRRR
jgi:Ca2+-binding RTX toxin-like protein